MRWQPVFRPAYRHRGKAIGVDPEVSYQQWMISILGKRRAFELHEQLRAELGAMTSTLRLPPELVLPDDPETDFGRLTSAEVAAVEEASYGHSLAETSITLGKSAETIKRQLSTASTRIGARSLAHLVALATRSGQVLSQQRPKGWRARQRLLAAMSEEELFAEARERRVRDAE